MDPLGIVDELRFDKPDEIPSDALDRFMPEGMTVGHPPTDTKARQHYSS